MTEEEARKKVCPLLSANIHSSLHMCIGSKCMMFRSYHNVHPVDTNPDYESNITVECGLLSACRKS